jgi:uncharacterized radical SAM superfamily Fe-S cluster-containing enzyme
MCTLLTSTSARIYFSETCQYHVFYVLYYRERQLYSTVEAVQPEGRPSRHLANNEHRVSCTLLLYYYE